MGRQLRRVALDFNWPLSKRWPGFLNPYYQYSKQCEDCEGSGYSPEARRIEDEWYGNSPFDPVAYGAKPLSVNSPALREVVERKINRLDKLVEQGHEKENWYLKQVPFYCARSTAVKAEIVRLHDIMKGQWCHQLIQADVDALVEAGRLVDFTHTWTPEDGWKAKDPPYHPTADEVNDWSLDSLGHDAINRGVCVRARCEREFVSGICLTCNGEGDIWTPKEAEQWAEEWEQHEPPTGEGYQLWETVSEGSPVSPVFSTPEELATWLVENDDSVTKETTYDQWMKFICGPGWCPSMMSINGELVDGVKAAGMLHGS